MRRYSVQKQAGEGAYGVVLQCYDKETNEYVAIKKFKGKEDDATIREVKLLRALKHPAIILMKDAFRVRGKLHLVFEYMEKNMLEVLQQHQRGLPEQDVKEYIYQLCLAIHHCHRHGVMHRDIKPENLLVNSDRTLKLCDFGVARALSKSGRHTDYVATRWYRAPELLVGRVDYSLPVDIFAIGCLMSEMLTGRPLFPGKTEADQLHILHRVLGPLPSSLDAFLRQNARFKGKIDFSADRAPGKGSDLRRFRPLDATLRGFVSPQGLDFMRALLEMDPARRVNCKGALQHPYFDDVRDAHDARVRAFRDKTRSQRHKSAGRRGASAASHKSGHHKSSADSHASGATTHATPSNPSGAGASLGGRHPSGGDAASTAGAAAGANLVLTAEQREALRRKRKQQRSAKRDGGNLPTLHNGRQHSAGTTHSSLAGAGAAAATGASGGASRNLPTLGAGGAAALQRTEPLGGGKASALTASRMANTHSGTSPHGIAPAPPLQPAHHGRRARHVHAPGPGPAVFDVSGRGAGGRKGGPLPTLNRSQADPGRAAPNPSGDALDRLFADQSAQSSARANHSSGGVGGPRAGRLPQLGAGGPGASGGGTGRAWGAGANPPGASGGAGRMRRHGYGVVGGRY